METRPSWPLRSWAAGSPTQGSVGRELFRWPHPRQLAAVTPGCHCSISQSSWPGVILVAALLPRKRSRSFAASGHLTGWRPRAQRDEKRSRRRRSRRKFVLKSSGSQSQDAQSLSKPVTDAAADTLQEEKEEEEEEGSDAQGYPFRSVDVSWPLKYARIIPPVGPDEPRPPGASGNWLPLFRNAAPYIAAFRGGTVVLHVPSFLLDDELRESFKGLMEDVSLCSILGVKIVVVTGIEKQVLKRLAKERAEPPVMTPGPQPRGRGSPQMFPRIIVDAETLKVVKQEAGLARVEVEGALSAGFEKRYLTSSQDDGSSKASSAGIFPLRGAVSVVSSMNFFSAGPVGVRDGIDCQYSGMVRSINTEVLRRRLDDGDIVSLTPLGGSPSGEAFFVSSEALAARVAISLKAMKLVYMTRGQRLVDTRTGQVIPGMQVRSAGAFLEHLRGSGGKQYSEEDLSSVWLTDFTRQLECMASAISTKAVGRAHLVSPFPGALLQEFYTTDGSGTVVAKDVYQGLGEATIGDANQIVALLNDDGRFHGVPTLSQDEVELACSKRQFFVWKRDEVVLGCGQLKPLNGSVQSTELCHFCMTENDFVTHASAFFAYGAQTAIDGGADTMWVLTTGQDQGRLEWFSKCGFEKPEPEDLHKIPSELQQEPWLLMRLGDAVAKTAASSFDAFNEEHRKWGGMQ